MFTRPRLIITYLAIASILGSSAAIAFENEDSTLWDSHIICCKHPEPSDLWPSWGCTQDGEDEAEYCDRRGLELTNYNYCDRFFGNPPIGYCP